MTARPMTAEPVLYQTEHAVAASLQRRPPAFGGR